MAPAYVYLIKMGRYHKIGTSRNVEKRAKQLDVGPHEPKVVHRFPSMNPYQVETAMHRRFRSRRVRGEWFLLTADEVAAIRAVSRCDAADDLPAGLVPSPEPELVQFNVRVSQGVLDDIEAVIAAMSDELGIPISRSAFLRLATAEAKKRYPPRAPAPKVRPRRKTP